MFDMIGVAPIYVWADREVQDWFEKGDIIYRD